MAVTATVAACAEWAVVPQAMITGLPFAIHAGYRGTMPGRIDPMSQAGCSQAASVEAPAPP